MARQVPIRSPWLQEEIVRRYERGGGLSKTVPGESMTVKELIERSKRGLPMTGKKVPFYAGEDLHYPDIERLDLSEIQELKIKSAQLIAEAEAKKKKEQEEKINKYDELELEYQSLKSQMEKNLKILEDVQKTKQE